MFVDNIEILGLFTQPRDGIRRHTVQCVCVLEAVAMIVILVCNSGEQSASKRMRQARPCQCAVLSHLWLSFTNLVPQHLGSLC
jgi:hypothetical protein